MNDILQEALWSALEFAGAYVDRELGIVDTSGSCLEMSEVVESLTQSLGLREIGAPASMVFNDISQGYLANPSEGKKATRITTKWFVDG